MNKPGRQPLETVYPSTSLTRDASEVTAPGFYVYQDAIGGPEQPVFVGPIGWKEEDLTIDENNKPIWAGVSAADPGDMVVTFGASQERLKLTDMAGSFTGPIAPEDR
jgi:hypothetical protein